jgi:hypothetical protein
MEVLSAIERETLKRLTEDCGFKTVSEHTGLSKHALKKALKEEGEIPEEDHGAILDYLKNRV